MCNLGIIVNKIAFTKLLLVFLLFEAIDFSSGDAVLVKFQSQLDTSKQLTICALKKPFTNEDINTQYPLVYIKPANPCFSFSNSSINGAVEFIKLDSPLTCTFASFVNNMQANKPRLVLIGSDGPFVRKKKLI
jgi:hypothetical protein